MTANDTSEHQHACDRADGDDERREEHENRTAPTACGA
jgi:hypothetical protein